jgi:Dynamin central region
MGMPYAMGTIMKPTSLVTAHAVHGGREGELKLISLVCHRLTHLCLAWCRNCQNTTTSILSSTLSTELIRTIRNKLPSLTSNIQSNISSLQQELYALGEDMPEGRGAMVHAIIELCGKVQEEYKQIINHVRAALLPRGLCRLASAAVC